MTTENERESIYNLADCIARLMVNVYSRMFNVQIALETLRKTCGEPLLDIAIEYAQNTVQQLCDAQSKAGELFARLGDAETEQHICRSDDTKKAYLRAALCRNNNWSESSLMRIAEAMGIEIAHEGSHGIVYLKMTDNELSIVQAAMAVVTKMRKTQKDERYGKK